MNFDNIKLMKDDYLKMMKFISAEFPQLPIVKFILWITFAIQIFSTLITFYFMIYVLSFKETFNYAAVAVGVSYPLFAILVLHFKGNVVRYIEKDLPMWSITCVEPKIQARFKKEAKVATVFMIFCMTISICGCAFYIQTLSEDEHIFFMIRFSKTYCPFFIYIYKATYPAIAYLLLVHFFQILYYCLHIRHQLIMLKTYTAAISHYRGPIKEENFFYCTDYQNEIRKRLIFCVDRHNQFIRAQKQKLDEMSNLIVTFPIVGTLFGMSVVLYLFYGKLDAEYKPRMFTISIASVLVFSGIIWSGQSIESQSGNASVTFSNIAWYNFNKSNKTLYLIFLKNALIVRKIKFSENLALNYKLGLSVLRGIYSIMSVLANTDLQLWQ